MISKLTFIKIHLLSKLRNNLKIKVCILEDTTFYMHVQMSEQEDEFNE